MEKGVTGSDSFLCLENVLFLSALDTSVNTAALSGRCQINMAFKFLTFFSIRLLALNDKSGAFAPITVGFSLRHLASSVRTQLVLISNLTAKFLSAM